MFFDFEIKGLQDAFPEEVPDLMSDLEDFEVKGIFILMSPY